MATDFPANPSNGDTHAGFTYNSTTGAWESSASTITGTEPPVILTEPPTTTQALNADGTTSTVTMTAQDPDGFDITYGIAYKTAGNALPDQLGSATTIDQSTGVYTFTPTTNVNNDGNFTARLSATDGIGYTTRLVNFSLTFSTPITFSSSEPGISTNLSNSIVWYVNNTLNSGGGGAQSANLLTGKQYFEIDVTSLSNPLLGLAPESMTDPGYLTSGQQSVYHANGNWYPGNISTGSIGAWGAGDILMIAYDTNTREMWMGQNGTWGLDPATDTGKSIGGTGAFTLWVGSGSSQGGNLTADILVGASNQNYSAPTGFSTH